jgi:tetratricopeptide (TPR) repeat protein
LAGNDVAGAELAFKRALEKQPGHANALLGLAEIAFKRNQPDQAGRLIRQAAQSEPGNAHAQSSLGRLLAVQKKYPEAEAALKKAAELDPKLVRPRMDLADLYATALRRPTDALSLYQRVLEIDPGHAGAHYAFGMTQMRLGDPAKARTALESSARLEPANPLPALALASLAIQRKDWDGAMTWLERALKIQPSLAEALELRGDVWQSRGGPDKALADYEAAFRAQPSRVSAVLKQASLLQQLGRADAAGKAYLAALKLNPRLALAYNNLAWMAVDSGKNLDQAEQWGRKAVELGPEVADFHDTLAWVYRARGRLKDAEQSLQRATGLKGAPASAHYHLGVVRRDLGKPAEAAAAFRKALALDKNHQPAAQALRQLAGN